MQIEINNNRKVFTIQEEFNTLFPNLKIAFHEKPSKPGGIPSAKMVKSSKSLSECRAVHNTGFITIVPAMTPDELKQVFRDIYQLSVKIYKSSESSRGDGIMVNSRDTLEELNKVDGYSKAL